MLTLDQFNKQYNADYDALKASEKISRETLRNMSRYILETIHNVDCDIRPVNKLLGILTPMNRKIIVEFFAEFSGFSYNAKEQVFGKKSQKTYDECKQLSLEFLENPNNNVWSWAAMQGRDKPEPKPFDAKEVAKAFSKQLKKAEKQGVQNAQVEILRSLFDEGLEVDAVISILEQMQVVDVA